MKIAILQCDHVLNKFQSSYGDYPQMIIELLTNVDKKLEIETFDVQKSEYPACIDDWDFFITTGSKASVNDNNAWITTFIHFIQQLDVAKKKLIGICFGHQIIALARGGVVEKASKGWGIGVASNQLINQPDWMKVTPDKKLNLIVSHQDQIVQLPQGAKVIAKSDFCPYFMIQWDEHFLSVQGHPEWHREYSKALINNRRNIIPIKRIDEALLSLKKAPNNREFAQWIIAFAKRNIF